MRLALLALIQSLAIVTLVGRALAADSLPPFADIHTHYNWDQKELISAEAVARKLEQANVAFTIVSSTPTHLVHELKAAAGDRVIPFFSPYTHELGKRDWHTNRELLVDADVVLSKGLYQGIGEVHFMVGFRPKTDNAVFTGLLRLAKQYDVPMLIHVDAGSEQVFRQLCVDQPDIRFIFAHAGGNLRAKHLQNILTVCNNVLVEFSARDPWRYGGLTGEVGQLLESWHDLILAYPDRFAVGTDPVWRVTRTQSWDEPDEGWDYFEQLLDYHRRWLAGLPKEVEQKVRLENAKRFLNR